MPRRNVAQPAAPEPLVRPAADPSRYAQCRSLGHEWRHAGRVTDDDQDRPFGVRYNAIGLRSKCSDCKKERVKWIDATGTTLRVVYDDAACPDYATHGDDRLSTQQWRKTFVTTLFETDLKPRRSA